MRFRFVYLLLLSVGVQGCSILDKWLNPSEEGHQFEELDLEKISYDVSFSPSLPGYVLDRLKKKSELIEYQKRPPTSTLALIRRIKKDQKIHEQVLDSLGFFDGSVGYETRVEKLPTQEITHIKFNVDLKDRYTLRDLNWIST